MATRLFRSDSNPSEAYPASQVLRDQLVCEILDGVSATDAAFWERALPGEPEGYKLQSGCENAGRGAFKLLAAVVRQGTRTLAVCPLFRVDYRLDTSLQGTALKMSHAINRLIPGIAHMRLLGFGSPYADICTLAVDPGLDEVITRSALRLIVETVMAHGRSEGIALFAVKDLHETRTPWFADVLRESGFTRMNGLPNCAVQLPYRDSEEYLATLSRPTRKDIRRKIKAAGAIDVEPRVGIDDIKHEIRALYEATRGASALDYNDFETLPENYFEAVSHAMGDRAVFMLYRIGGELVGFNLLLIGNDRIVDKFLGMRRDKAEQHNLYVFSWMQNIKYCIERGIPAMQFGPTAYGLKLRFGSQLQESGIWFRHTGPIANGVLKRLAPLVAFDRLDPELSKWRKRQAQLAKGEPDDN
ncbi:MAG: GNAT family N-acetyltransferase [Hyphomicrobiaceae bacterium]|nr:GNAT family N-acetyltransferase [Hyphomicrobiaceae bacterium]